eukprot:2784375-Rhodomonas_salina.2
MQRCGGVFSYGNACAKESYGAVVEGALGAIFSVRERTPPPQTRPHTRAGPRRRARQRSDVERRVVHVAPRALKPVLQVSARPVQTACTRAHHDPCF